MARPYYLLRRKMLARQVTITDVANEFGISKTAVSKKLNNRSPWKLDEIWTVMGLLQIDPGKMALYFPKNGKNE